MDGIFQDEAVTDREIAIIEEADEGKFQEIAEMEEVDVIT
ncbi:hypothetical protein Hsar01_00699 [Haloferula sargassicola]|uniref:Uncharacterized protein n=1 Tax=Haloferula sargassicola TaxID=490096 RepID=A0ABP9UIZ8_9BACT